MAKVVLAEESERFAVLRDRAITVPTVEWSALVRSAVTHRNRRDEERAWHRAHHVPTPARAADVEELTLQRRVVNYLRHELTVYDSESEELVGKVGRTEATSQLRRRVYAASSRAYPMLAQECQRQLQQRE